jgi:hypothetical protein
VREVAVWPRTGHGSGWYALASWACPLISCSSGDTDTAIGMCRPARENQRECSETDLACQQKTGESTNPWMGMGELAAFRLTKVVGSRSLSARRA